MGQISCEWIATVFLLSSKKVRSWVNHLKKLQSFFWRRCSRTVVAYRFQVKFQKGGLSQVFTIESGLWIVCFFWYLPVEVPLISELFGDFFMGFFRWCPIEHRCPVEKIGRSLTGTSTAGCCGWTRRQAQGFRVSGASASDLRRVFNNISGIGGIGNNLFDGDS